MSFILDNAETIASLRQQLVEVNTLFAGAVEQLAEASRKRKEAQAREKLAKREALLEALPEFERMAHGIAGAGVFPEKLQIMLKELV